MCTVVDPETGAPRPLVLRHPGAIAAVAFSPDGWRLASASADGTVKVWDATPWAEDRPAYEIRTLQGAAAPLFSAAFHPDGLDGSRHHTTATAHCGNRSEQGVRRHNGCNSDAIR